MIAAWIASGICLVVVGPILASFTICVPAWWQKSKTANALKRRLNAVDDAIPDDLLARLPEPVWAWADRLVGVPFRAFVSIFAFIAVAIVSVVAFWIVAFKTFVEQTCPYTDHESDDRWVRFRREWGSVTRARDGLTRFVRGTARRAEDR